MRVTGASRGECLWMQGMKFKEVVHSGVHVRNEVCGK